MIAQDSCTASVVHQIHDSLTQQQKWPKSPLFVQISHHRMNISCQYLFVCTEKNKSQQILAILTANVMEWKQNLDIEASWKSSSCACESRVTRFPSAITYNTFTTKTKPSVIAFCQSNICSFCECFMSIFSVVIT